MNEDRFNDIRPYYDAEVPAAIAEVLAEPEFEIFTNYLFPDRKKEDVYAEFAGYKTLFDFQWNFAYRAIKVIIDRSVKSLTFTGIKELPRESNFLFMSNHRDIVLDPALINVCLFDNKIPTAQMAIGNNLLISPMVNHLFKLNKSFIVQRNESPRQLYEAWRNLSAYISHVVCERHENLWIAQREGRAKDGDDRTQTGILKMFLMNFGGDFINTIKRLNIVPVSVSYEYDPCDYLKALELFSISNEIPFVKDSTFNLKSMLTGLQGYKGNVMVTFGRSLNDVVDLYPGLANQNDWIKWLTNLIDTEIHRNYHLWPTNYLAYDMLVGTHKFADRYDDKVREEFNRRLDKQLEDATFDKEALRTLILTNYANCVINKIEAYSGNVSH